MSDPAMPGSSGYPGVYVEEIPGGMRRIEGVATSLALFAGWTPRGPDDAARRVDSFADFEHEFGGLDARSLLGYAVQPLFADGGGTLTALRADIDDGCVNNLVGFAPLEPAGFVSLPIRQSAGHPRDAA